MEQEMRGLWGGQKRKLSLFTCEQCDKSFYARPPRGDRKVRFCSPECSSIARRTRSLITCSVCGKQVERTPSKVKLAKHGFMFCSRVCKEQAQSIESDIPIKPSHYKEGKSVYRSRAIKEYGASCKKCGYSSDERMLDVHHIDKKRSNNKLENLVVLCVWCHALVTRGVEDI